MGQQSRDEQGKCAHEPTPLRGRILPERAEIGENGQHREQGAGLIRLTGGPGHGLDSERVHSEQCGG
jgi:hypothetical protein